MGACSKGHAGAVHASTLVQFMCWGNIFCELDDGVKPFSGFSAAAVLEKLRLRLKVLKVEEAYMYRTHDFRRGHAKDLQYNGASLKEILSAGEWSPPAYLQYQDVDKMEHDMVLSMYLDDSDGNNPW